MSQSKYGNTQVSGEYIRLPLTFALDYDADYSMSYTNRSLVDKEYVDGLFGAVPQVWNLVSPGELVLDASVTGAVIPLNDDSNDLGSSTNRWRDLYLGSKIDAVSELEFFNNGALSATISSSGEMLIGTSTGGAKLKVRGSTSGGFGTYAVAVEDASGAQLFYVDNGGYIGVGGPSNGSSLYVKGKGTGYGYNIWLQGSSGNPKLYMFDNGELHIDPATLYETVKHTSGRWDFPNVVSIGKPIITGNEALYIKGLGNTSATYSMLIENSSSDPIVSVRDNSKVYIKATGGFSADVTLGVAGFTQTAGWRSRGYNRIEYGSNDFAGDARPSIEWNTSTLAGQFITGIKNDDTWGIFCSPASDFGFEIDRTTRNIGLSNAPVSDTKLRIRGNGSTSSTKTLSVFNSLSSTPSLEILDNQKVFIGIQSSNWDGFSQVDIGGSYLKIRQLSNALSVGDSGTYTGDWQYGASGGKLQIVKSGIGTAINFFSFGNDNSVPAGTYVTANNVLRLGGNITWWQSIDQYTKFAIKSDNTSGSTYAFRAYNSSDQVLFVITDTAKVGIGELSPTARLHVKGEGATSATTNQRWENSSSSHLMSLNDAGQLKFGGPADTFLEYNSGSGAFMIGNSIRANDFYATFHRFNGPVWQYDVRSTIGANTNYQMNQFGILFRADGSAGTDQTHFNFNVATGTSTANSVVFKTGIGATDFLTIYGDQRVKISGLPTYADDASAGAGGLTTGFIYKTATGELRIKL